MNFQNIVKPYLSVFKSPGMEEYHDKFIDECEYQAIKLVPIGFLINLFLWIPYFYLDQEIYPNQTIMPLIRLGLSALAFLSIIIFYLKPFKYTGMFLGCLNLFYCVVGSALEVVISGFDSAYIGGFFITVLFSAFISPLPLFLNYLIAASGYLTIAVGYYLRESILLSKSQQYSIQDMFTSLILITVFIYMQNRIRFSLFKQSKEVKSQRKIIEEKEAQANNLLLNILPSEIAEELKQQRRVNAKAYSMVTVMFTDFKDFTKVSEQVSAELLVAEIDYCFSAFDNILQNYKIEKIKTVGDSYICAAGMPELTYTHAVDMVHAAIEFNQFMLLRKREKEANGEIPFEMRIGIHTGPLVAGVVGFKKFAYDIWGDTVNIATRIEQNCEAGKINLSGTTYALVKHAFHCEYRGKIPAKNKDDIDMYFVKTN